MEKNILTSADILLPNFEKVSGCGWSVVACDQFTSERAYWERAEALTGDQPSTLRLILPEAYPDETADRLPKINAAMSEYLNTVLLSHPVISSERVRYMRFEKGTNFESNESLPLLFSSLAVITPFSPVSSNPRPSRQPL